MNFMLLFILFILYYKINFGAHCSKELTLGIVNYIQKLKT